MNFIVRVTRLPLKQSIRATFSTGICEEQEVSADKVFITFEEKKTLSRLLNKIEESELTPDIQELRFKHFFKQILKKYDISCEAFEAQVMNLHRNC